MYIYRGHNRFVLVGQKIVIKFPRIHIYKAVKGLSLYRGEKWYLFGYYDAHVNTFQRLLLKGIMDNIHEFFFSLKYWRNVKIIQPTLFSLFGLLNIQIRKGVPISSNIDISQQLRDLSDNDPRVEAHVFNDRNNLWEVTGHLRISDYGSPESRDFIKTYGRKIFNNLILDDQQ